VEAHPLNAAIDGLRHAAYGLYPAERLFDPFALLDRQGVALVSGDATVDRCMARFLRDMRGHTGLAQIDDEPGRILPFVGPQRQPPGRSGGVAVG